MRNLIYFFLHPITTSYRFLQYLSCLYDCKTFGVLPVIWWNYFPLSWSQPCLLQWLLAPLRPWFFYNLAVGSLSLRYLLSLLCFFFWTQWLLFIVRSISTVSLSLTCWSLISSLVLVEPSDSSPPSPFGNMSCEFQPMAYSVLSRAAEYINLQLSSQSYYVKYCIY